jgi:hydrogenase nickel incorporation protein HypB
LQVLEVNRNLLIKNDEQARRNRSLFKSRGVLAVNVLASPGAGKTALLERTLADLCGRHPAAVVVGDLATDHDGRRLRRSGAAVVQLTTGTVCHLEAEMVARAVEQLPLDGLRLLFIENVGNLVCPAGYDLGEGLRVVLLSVTEGEDKPLKYPKIFKSADAVVVTKTDLAGPAGFDAAAARGAIESVAPQAEVFWLSARTGEGLGPWYAYLERRLGHGAG